MSDLHDMLQRAEDEAKFLLSKSMVDSKAQALEHLAGAILWSTVIAVRQWHDASTGDNYSEGKP